MHNMKRKFMEQISGLKITPRRGNTQMLLIIVATALFSHPILALKPSGKSNQTEWHSLWNQKDFSGWTIWLNVPQPGSSVPGIPRDAKGNYIAAIGLNKDPLGVFTVVEKDGLPSIRISGEIFGELRTKESFGNYHLRLEYKWGEKKWPPSDKPEKRRNSGLYYHIHSAPGADDMPWPHATEFQIMEHDAGDLYAVNSLISVRSRPYHDKFRNRNTWIYDPNGEYHDFSRVIDQSGQPASEGRCVKSFDNEKPYGQWNTIELICLGDECIHIVNGKVVMRLHAPRRIDTMPPVPVTEGPFFLQSEGAEIFYRNIKVRPITAVPAEFSQVDVNKRIPNIKISETNFEPAPIVIDNAPTLRSMSEVKTILGDAIFAKPNPKAKTLHIVLCASEKDKAHNKPGIHDYPLWRKRWLRLLAMDPHIMVEAATDWPNAEQWSKADVIVMYSHNPAWELEADSSKVSANAAQLDRFLARGGGIVFLHSAICSGSNAPQLAERLGLAWTKGSRYRHDANSWVIDKSHPLATGFNDWQITDESYWNLTGKLSPPKDRVIMSSVEENSLQPQMWTRELGSGRVFVSVPGHYTWSFDDPLFRILIFRGLMWAAHQPMDRLAPLVTIGARIQK